YINSPSWNRLAFYDDDDEYSIQYKEYFENSSNAIVPVLHTEEPDNSLSMGDEHLSTILETESDEVIKSSDKNLIPIPSESEVTSENENTLIESSPKFDYLLKEFSCELAHINSIPPGIKNDDYDSKGDIHILEELLSNDSLPILENELSNFDHHDDLSFPRPPSEPLDVE
nr:hypothetical protein [Tanacetum cinerariifolium]